MTPLNSLFSSIQEAQQLIEQTSFSSEENENQKIQMLESLVQRIVPLFEKNQQIDLLEKDHQSLEDLALKYTANYPVLEPFLIQLFPMKFPSALQWGKTNPLCLMIDQILEDGHDLSRLMKLCQILPNTESALSLFIDKIERIYSSSEENKTLAYQILTQKISKNKQIKQLQNCVFVFAKKNSNSLLAFETAKILAEQKNSEISKHIEKYGITNQEWLIEIAKIAADKNGVEVSEFIQNYKIQNEADLFTVFLIAITNTPKTIDHLENYHFSNNLFQRFTHFFSILNKDPSIFQLLAYCINVSFSQGWEIQTLLERFPKDSNHQKIVLLWCSDFLRSCLNQKISQSDFSFLLNSGLIKATWDCHDRFMRYVLTKEMIALTKNEKGRKEFFIQFSPDHEKKLFSFLDNTKKLPLLPEHAKLPLLLISSIQAQGISKNDCKKLCEKARDRFFKDGKNLKIFINFLNLISQTEELTAKEKEYLLTFFLEIPNKQHELAISHMRSIQAIADLHQTFQLKNLRNLDLNDILLKSFRNIGMPIKSTKNFAERFLEIFEEAKVPNYIILYAAKIALLDCKEKEELFPCLASIVDDILENQFYKNRYDITKSLHLRTIFESRLELFEKWKQGEKNINLMDFIQEEAPEKLSLLQKKYLGYTLHDTDHFEDLFLIGTVGTCQSIDGDPSLSKCLMSYVADGKTRALIVKDDQGTIIARHIFQILWDGKTPVLFLETMYPNSGVIPPEIRKALIEFAKRRAKELEGLPLLYQEIDNGKQYPYPICSLSGNRAPYEYVDGIIEILNRITNGVYTIRKAFIV